MANVKEFFQVQIGDNTGSGLISGAAFFNTEDERRATKGHGGSDVAVGGYTTSRRSPSFRRAALKFNSRPTRMLLIRR